MNRALIAGMALLGAAVATAPRPAAAQVTTFNFTGGNTPSEGAAGNSLIFFNNNNSISVKVTAWSLVAANGTPAAAYLGWYDRGLGVTNSISGNATNGYTTTDNSHAIDNVGYYDFVTLEFSKYVQILVGTLTPYDVTDDNVNNPDNDPSVSFTGGSAYSTANAAQQADLRLHTTELQGKTTGDFKTNLNPGMNTGNIWTIGADRLSALSSDMNDGFKLSALTVQIPTPEPASWALMIAGFGMVGGTLRRQGGRRRLAVAG